MAKKADEQAADREPIPVTYGRNLVDGVGTMASLMERLQRAHHLVSQGMADDLRAHITRLAKVADAWQESAQQGQFKPE